MVSAAAPTLWDFGVASREADESVLHERAVSGGIRSTHGQAQGGAFRPETPIREGGATLDQAITRLWQAITQHHQVTCPWCEGEMRPRYSAAPLPVGGRCADCGASLT